MEISASAFSSGISALQSGQRRVEQAAADIAGNAVVPAPVQTPPQTQVGAASQTAEERRPDLTESLVALRIGENEAKTGARLVKTADEVLGTLIDTTA
ncbi:hypothetical protein [Pseudomonas zhanjiangensis]|uniref:Pyrroloquinoline quinone biosynthesis protein PqqE n=1 Tax=Pseudomonas zhanjiangensis TaxID=3239015 RepID=A0ABV3YU90_9PSED